MRDWIEHEATLTLDGDDCHAEPQAFFTMTVEVYRGQIFGFVRCTLTRWVLNGVELDRATACTVLGGSDEVERQEQIVGKHWWDRPAIAAE